ncbi:MAG: PQQ-binding-like beta-propeller repeat protein [Candidatus Bathyarchaeia archaeon]
MSKNKTALVVSLILMFAMIVSLVALPSANAQGTMATYCFLGATPNPVGVGQEVLLHVGITRQLNIVWMGWEGLSITITKPDGSTETIRDIRTDSTGGTGVVYVPTMAGNYTLQAHFPEQVTTSNKYSPGVPIGTVMLASDSEKLTLVVLQEPVPEYPAKPLPTEYWTRPINAQLREWASIAGSWPGTPRNNFARYNDDAPETGHILWTKLICMGGLVGGGLEGMGGPAGFETGAAYEQKFGAPAVLAGILYYNRFEERGGTAVEQEVVAVDLHTGAELWVRNWNRTRLSVGQLFYWQSYNYMGTFAYLWQVSGTTWNAFDAFTGRWIYTMTNVPATTSTYGGGLGSNSWFGPRGEIYAYTVNLANGWMTLWNSSRVVSIEGSWRPHGNTYNCSVGQARNGGYEWNITIPKGLSGSVQGVRLEDKVVGSSVSLTQVNTWAFSLKPGQEGVLLYNKTWKAPDDWSKGNQTISWSVTSMDDEVGLVWSKETLRWWGFSLKTGDYLWGPTASQHYLGTYGTSTAVAYGKLFECYMSGIVYCYNITTGELLWTYNIRDPYNEVLWGVNWPSRINFVADGKLYLTYAEHSPNQPLPRGGPMTCIDTETGEKIWSISMMYYYRTNIVIGDNIIAVHNSYDQQIYAIGKGPSAITVSAGPEVSVHGSSVLVKGYVTDVSPGTKSPALQMRFPNGVPAVADESMSAWMEYVYMQFPRPTDAKGVEVVVSVLDPNGNCYEVGRTTSDANGFFKLSFTPPVPGEYTVIATFAGSKAYYGSSAETALYVEEAPPPTPPPTPTPASVADMYLLPGIVAIIITIVVIGLVIILLLRKR